ncbi:MAG TPA: DUF3261 domain-containing protein [Steroidobacteraceae bacterium]|nr:DUF3261 domain-containing protein [Steroidobacteraceae bacterium]
MGPRAVAGARALAGWLLGAVACALAGCVTTPPRAGHVPAATANATNDAGAAPATLPLLAPASLGQTRQFTQLLRGDYGDTSFSLRCVVSIDDRQLSVIGLTALGQRAFTLKYDGAQLDEERAPQLPQAIGGVQLLNDLQLVYWPLPALQKAWQTAGGEVSEPYPGTRRLKRGGRLVAEVHYAADAWSGRVWLRHFDTPYSLFIETE